MRKLYAILAAMSLILLAVPALADKGKDKEPPPKGGESCSPGYWKNHMEIWDNGVCCDGDTGVSCAGVDDALRARGPGGNILREGAANFLEACLGQPCNDD